VNFAIRTAGACDLGTLRELFRRASLSNEGDRGHLLAHPESLLLSDDAIRQGRTRVAATSDGEIVGFASWLVNENTIELETFLSSRDG